MIINKLYPQNKVIIKRLASIENFGSMDVLCSDKTGTLTEGSVRLHSALDLDGHASDRVFLHATNSQSVIPEYIHPRNIHGHDKGGCH